MPFPPALPLPPHHWRHFSSSPVSCVVSLVPFPKFPFCGAFLPRINRAQLFPTDPSSSSLGQHRPNSASLSPSLPSLSYTHYYFIIADRQHAKTRRYAFRSLDLPPFSIWHSLAPTGSFPSSSCSFSCSPPRSSQRVRREHFSVENSEDCGSFPRIRLIQNPGDRNDRLNRIAADYLDYYFTGY